MEVDPARIRAAWQGRVSGCLLGKPVEVLSFQAGHAGLTEYLREAEALPLRGYIPLVRGTIVDELGGNCCRGHIVRAEPDDDINYTLLALLILEESGPHFDTADVARAWLNRLPAGTTWTAERAAYLALLENMDAEFVNGADSGFDLSICSENEFSDWIGAQIRADLYGWVCPGRPALAAKLAGRDAALSHRGEGALCAVFIAALAACVPVAASLDDAIDKALEQIPPGSEAAGAVHFGRAAVQSADPVKAIHARYAELSPVHSINNLALVIWALLAADGDFSRAVGDAVSAGLDTDCNGATVGGLCGLAGFEIPAHWTSPWAGRIAFSLAGIDELSLDDVARRTADIAHRINDDKTLH